MWRIQGLVSRVLSRCHGSGPLRFSNGHHVEDEVIGSSTALTTGRHASDNSSHRGEKEKQNKKRQSSQFCYARLPRYTALDAVGWGAAAVLFMQICRRIHSQFSSVGDQKPGAGRLRGHRMGPKCTYRILLDILSKRDILPGGVGVMCLKGALASSEQDDSANKSSSSSSADAEQDKRTTLPTSHQQGSTLSHNITEETSPDFDVCKTASTSAVHDQPEEKTSLSLEEAEQKLRATADNSVPVILNIMGLESAKAGDYEAAFQCFLASAQQHYSKAQYNVGVCYEKGHGVQQDLNKALQFYRLAAAAGHTQAQYRCAKLLLNSRGQQSDTDTSTALSLLHAAAESGLTQAQLYLGVLLSQGVDEGVKAVQFFRMAADKGDSTGLLYLGQCYERGFGVAQSYGTALGLYQQSADRGNKSAKNLLRDLHSREVLRSIRSAPCLSVLDQLSLSAMFPQVFQGAESSTTQHSQHHWPTQQLSHSWSTGSLLAPPPFSTQTHNTNGKNGGWIIGVG